MSIFRRKSIFLDYASATPVRREVERAMKPFLSKYFHNPSAVYSEGEMSREALERARTVVARSVHAGARDVVFTSGGTESDNIAVLGVCEAAKETIARPHVIALSTDHPAILEAVHEAKRRGAELTIIETDAEGSVRAEDVLREVKENTVLITLSFASSEVGTVHPVSKIGRLVKAHRKEHGTPYPYLHVDASQAVNTMPINVDALHADLLTLDASKIYGPKGVGALIVRPRVAVRPLIVGGGQERGLRSGTENVAGIAGFTEALALLEKERAGNVQKFSALKQLFLDSIDRLGSIQLNGRLKDSLPNIVSITVPGALHEFLAIKLALRGVLVSTGSSCSTRKNEPDKEALRFSFGKETTKKDVIAAVRNLSEILL